MGKNSPGNSRPRSQGAGGDRDMTKIRTLAETLPSLPTMEGAGVHLRRGFGFSNPERHDNPSFFSMIFETATSFVMTRHASNVFLSRGFV